METERDAGSDGDRAVLSCCSTVLPAVRVSGREKGVCGFDQCKI